MGLNIDAIRQKLDQISGKKNSMKTWRPEKEGVYKARALPWPSKLTADGTPFVERYFYYIGDNVVLAPKQFDLEDPVAELSEKLWKSKKATDKEAAKKLFAKMTAYIPIIVKDEEEKGVQLYKINFSTHQRLLGFLLDEDIGDFMDVENGFDLKITATTGKRVFNNKPVLEVVIDVGRQGPLKKWFGDDVTKMNDALNNLPSVDELTKSSKKTAPEIKLMLDKWLAGDEEDETTGTTRGKDATDELEKLATEVAEETKKPAKKQVLTDSVEATKSSRSALDDAFDELENS